MIFGRSYSAFGTILNFKYSYKKVKLIEDKSAL